MDEIGEAVSRRDSGERIQGNKPGVFAGPSSGAAAAVQSSSVQLRRQRRHEFPNGHGGEFIRKLGNIITRLIRRWRPATNFAAGARLEFPLQCPFRDELRRVNAAVVRL